MGFLPLADQSILVVEDESLIALDLAEMLQSAGAEVVTVKTIKDAMLALEQHQFSAAVLDCLDDIATLCQSLRARSIPWVFYSGRCELEDTFPGAVVVPKPSSGAALVGAISGLLEGVEPLTRQPQQNVTVAAA